MPRPLIPEMVIGGVLVNDYACRPTSHVLSQVSSLEAQNTANTGSSVCPVSEREPCVRIRYVTNKLKAYIQQDAKETRNTEVSQQTTTKNTRHRTLGKARQIPDRTHSMPSQGQCT